MEAARFLRASRLSGSPVARSMTAFWPGASFDGAPPSLIGLALLPAGLRVLAMALRFVL